MKYRKPKVITVPKKMMKLALTTAPPEVLEFILGEINRRSTLDEHPPEEV